LVAIDVAVDAEERGVFLRSLHLDVVPDPREERGLRDPDLSPGLRDARGGDPEVVVARDRLREERLERGIAEDLPPRKIGYGRRPDRRDLAAELLRRTDGWALVVGTDCAAGEEHADDNDDPATGREPHCSTAQHCGTAPRWSSELHCGAELHCRA